MDAARNVQSQDVHLPASIENDLCGFRVTVHIEFRGRVLAVERAAHQNNLTRERHDAWIKMNRQRQIGHRAQREYGNLPGVSTDFTDDQVCRKLSWSLEFPRQCLSIC